MFFIKIIINFYENEIIKNLNKIMVDLSKSEMPEIDLEKLAKEIFNEHNYLRKNPQSYIEKLERVSRNYKGKYLRHPMEIPIETYEGIQGIKDTIEFLKNQEPVKELIYSEELSLAARDHVIDIGDKGISGHRGSNKSTLNERIEKYIEWNGLISESIQYCYQFASNIIMSLLIDDGSKDKHQRLNLFSEDFNYVGIGCGGHKKYHLCTVINYAKELFPLETEPPRKKEINYNLNLEENEAVDIDGNIINKEQIPENVDKVEVLNIIKKYNGIEHPFVRKIFHLNNGKEHILDIEDN